MENNNKKNTSIFDDKRVVLVASLVLAALLWILIAGFLDPGGNKTLERVPIDYDLNQADYINKNLQIVDRDELTADVRLTGDSAVLGGLNSSSIRVAVDYSNVTGPGTFSCTLVVSRLTTASFFSTVSINNDQHSLTSNPWDRVTVTFEEVERKSFPVSVQVDGVTAATGYYRDTPVAQPVEVRVSGPASEVARVAQVTATVEAEEELSELAHYAALPVTLLDAAGNVLDPAAMGLTLSSETVDVDIPVYEIRTINLGAEFIGFGRNFDTEWFYSRVKLSAGTLQVVGAASAFTHLDDPLIIATFDVSELSAGWVSDPVDIVLPEGLRNQDQLRQVTVSLDTAGLVEKTFEIPASQIRVVNGPQGAAITPMAESVSVKLLGEAEQMDGLLAENITVQLDAGAIAAKDDQQTIAGRVQVPGANRVLAVGSYPIVCDVTVDE